jgi:N,N-dimethylformamidase
MQTLTGYSDRISARPGETVSFFVSSENESAYAARLVRLIHGDENPDGPGYSDEVIPAGFDGIYPGICQKIKTGSFGLVDQPEPLSALASFTVTAIIWPTMAGRGEQVVMAHWDGSRGFQLLIDAGGCAAVTLGDGSETVRLATGAPLVSANWYLIVAAYDGVTGAIDIRHSALHPRSLATARHTARAYGAARFVPARDAALTFAARLVASTSGQQPHGEQHYNGKLEAPRIFDRVLDDAELVEAATAEGGHAHPALVAGWDFSVAIDTMELRERSRNRLNGRTINLPTRAMTGHVWTGEEMNWTHRPEHYGAIHFHDDDLCDAGWQPSFVWQVPEGLSSGLYSAHLVNDDGEEFIPVVVRPPLGKPAARLALLLPTASYLAYGNERCGTDAKGRPLFESVKLKAHDHFLNAHPEYGLSLYDRHNDGSGVAYASRLRPLVNMRPKVRSWLGGKGSAVWQFNADTHITHFLESAGIDFDILTDEDLDCEGVAAIADYACVLTGTHPEYWSTRMLSAIEEFKDQGGRLVYMGGNGFYWRVAYHPELAGVMEVRRAEGGIRSWAAIPGEYYHSFTGELGGLWQRVGRSPQTVVGVGMTSQGFDRSTYFRRTAESHDPRVAFAFDGVDEAVIGDFGLIGGGAAGSEIDRADFAWGTPGHALVVARSENHSDAYLVAMEDMYEPSRDIGGAGHPLIHADMTFFETPAGGAVFAMSSIAWAGSLSHEGFDNNVARISANVLRRFIDPAPFMTP